MSYNNGIEMNEGLVYREGRTKTKNKWNRYSKLSVLSTGFCLLCVLTINGILAIASVNAFLSIGSCNSILSIGSLNSILSIGSFQSVLSFGSSGSLLAVNCKNQSFKIC
ncbi:hypothetical protein M0813_23141 [Anaeramoeba flamelloides]|uniref:Uncharacterized protein n=1 Tax=Anaeramoeba flamelloides TaxID=1746091 RepID=A0ABQ8YBB5_9EUKA|nr:hypothetical protein M0813_23141 [Anaeramoeba flamelloides]